MVCGVIIVFGGAFLADYGSRLDGPSPALGAVVSGFGGVVILGGLILAAIHAVMRLRAGRSSGDDGETAS